MKIKNLALILTAALFLFVGVAYADLNDGLVAYWPFNGDAYDESINDNHASALGATLTTDRFGNPDSAYSFDGANDYIIFPATNMPTGERTVVLWLYTTDTSANRLILGYGGNSNNPLYSSFSIYFKSADKRVIEVHRHYPGGEVFTYTASSPLTNAWYQLALTSDSTGNILYLNGKPAFSNSTVLSTYVAGKDGFIGAIATGSGIGPYIDSNYPLFRGKIDDVRIYERALTGAEIQALYDQETPPSEGPVAFYPFNGNANDEGIIGNHGTVYGATLTTDRFGNPDSAYSFDGIDDYIDASSNGLPTATRTVSAWFYANTLDNHPALLAYGGGVCCTSWLMLINNLDLTPPGFEVQSHGRVNRIAYTYAMEPIGAWYHWVVTTDHDGTKMYINGELKASNGNFISNTIVNTSTEIAFGVDVGTNGIAPYSDINSNYFNGKIDDIRIYDRVLSESEIQALYNEDLTCIQPPSDMVSWWPGDGDSDDILGGKHGTWINGVGYESGKVGEAFRFNGSSFVSVPDNPIWTLGDDEFTIDMWVQFGEVRYRSPFIGHDESGGQNNKWIFWYDAGGHDKPGGPAMRFHINSPTLPPIDTIYYPWNPNAGQWYHVAVTRIGDEYALYIDGVHVATDININTIPDPNAPLTLGKAEGYNFNGLIDEVEIFNRALSSAEIAEIYDAGSAGKCKVSNQSPTVTVDQDTVTVEEGQEASNLGTVGDSDGDYVTLTASVGTVANSGDGTWSWSFETADGPAESQTVTIAADDGNGGSAQVNFALVVNNVAPSVDAVSVPLDPVQIGTPVVATAQFSDPAGVNDEPYTCTVNYGDGIGDESGTVTNTSCAGNDHYYAEPGVYTVSITVTDKDGGSGSAQATEYVVIYDPYGGFVTGGGWIWSPAGSYAADSGLEGKANYGFVSKYAKKSTDVPIGQTQFQFKAGDLDFHSDSYEWLVIAGSKAMYKGTGTINGVGNYGFMLMAIDAALTPSTDADLFRIKIWDKDDGDAVVYDNQMNAAEDADPTTTTGGGNIMIHKSK